MSKIKHFPNPVWKWPIPQGAKVSRGYETGIVTGIVSDFYIRVYWNSNNNMYYETVNINEVTLIPVFTLNDSKE